MDGWMDGWMERRRDWPNPPLCCVDVWLYAYRLLMSVSLPLSRRRRLGLGSLAKKSTRPHWAQGQPDRRGSRGQSGWWLPRHVLKLAVILRKNDASLKATTCYIKCQGSIDPAKTPRAVDAQRHARSSRPPVRSCQSKRWSRQWLSAGLQRRRCLGLHRVRSNLFPEL